VRDLELAGWVLLIVWGVELVLGGLISVLVAFEALWERLDELARTRRRWWGPR
jgi:hypothetical protein